MKRPFCLFDDLAGCKLVVILFILFSDCALAQSASGSESLIKYNLQTFKADKEIPFDHPFTLIVDKLSTKNLDSIEVFQTKYIRGNREDVTNFIRMKDSNSLSHTPVKDFTAKHNSKGDSLEIYFPPLKPNVRFDVNVVYKLSLACRKKLLEVNAKFESGNDASPAYTAFRRCTLDQEAKRQYMSLKLQEYRIFYDATIVTTFKAASDLTNYEGFNDLNEDALIAIDLAIPNLDSAASERYYLFEAVKRNLLVSLQNGLVDISKIVNVGPIVPAKVTLYDRQSNLSKNLIYFTDVLKRIDLGLLNGEVVVDVYPDFIDLNEVRTSIETIRVNIYNNHKKLSDYLTTIDGALDNNPRLRQCVFLSGDTQSNDLKTDGGKILFLDAGISGIAAEKLNGKTEIIPKLYLGVSIYFRPIDKNTRKGTFSSKFSPKRFEGYNVTKNGINYYGPDYGIATKWSVWQHLSLNIGLTLGSITHSEFGNLMSSNSLLIGPAIRFHRAFKISSGVALIRRSSENPVISEKKVLAGPYVAVSVDFDFIESIKNVTSKLF